MHIPPEAFFIILFLFYNGYITKKLKKIWFILMLKENKMRPGYKTILYGGAALIIGASIAAGGKVAGLFRTFDPDYWKREVIEEKADRVKLLDEAASLGNDGVYSTSDMERISRALVLSTGGFNYMDCDKGDLAAYDNPVSPGDPIMGYMNVRYLRILQTENVRSVVSDLGKSHEAGRPVALGTTDLDERVDKAIGGIRATLTDPESHQADLRSAVYRTQSRKWMLGGSGGLIAGLLGCFGLGFLYSQKEA